MKFEEKLRNYLVVCFISFLSKQCIIVLFEWNRFEIHAKIIMAYCSSNIQVAISMAASQNDNNNIFRICMHRKRMKRKQQKPKTKLLETSQTKLEYPIQFIEYNSGQWHIQNTEIHYHWLRLYFRIFRLYYSICLENQKIGLLRHTYI